MAMRRSSLTIRPEWPGAVAAIRLVDEAAFPTPAEAGLVDRLRADGDLVLSLVAEQDGIVVGHVVFSRIVIERDDDPGTAVSLAPVAVLPQYQRAGVGKALIARGLATLAERGESVVFVLGDPAYYGRFGFTATEAARFVSDYAGPYLQALRLAGRRVTPGRLRYASAFAALG
jgi:putative acetyltransferase